MLIHLLTVRKDFPTGLPASALRDLPAKTFLPEKAGLRRPGRSSRSRLQPPGENGGHHDDRRRQVRTPVAR